MHLGEKAIDMSWRLLVIKSGGNQHYIFGTNKRRLNVGASYLLTLMPEWIDEAAEPFRGDVHHLVSVSGVAQLLVRTPDLAREIIRSVTRQALTLAPGLEVWGWYEQDPAPQDATLAERLRTALRRMEQRRSQLPSPLSRFPMTPFSQPCAVTGEPAEFDTRGGFRFGPNDPVRLSPRANVQHDYSRRGLAYTRNLMRVENRHAIVSEDRLDEGVDDDGWVAIVHADGNGFGQMLADLGLATDSPADYPHLLKEVSDRLSSVALTALNQAVAQVLVDAPKEQGWLLPLIVGGDDLTAIVNARLARPFVTAYLRAFEEASAADEILRVVARKVLGSDHLTACAGIAVVKPTMPFHQAYDLAEGLCRSAKSVKRTLSTPVSAFDVQVIHEAAGRDVEDIRRPSWQPAGPSPTYDPYVTSERAAPGPCGPGSGSDAEWIDAHHADHLTQAITFVATDEFSGAIRHRTRTALTLPPQASARARDVLVSKAFLSARPEVRAWAPAFDAWFRDHGGQRGLTAIDLADVEAS